MALTLAGERGIMDSLRKQANVVGESADRGICGAAVGRGARHHGQSQVTSKCN